MSALRVLPNVLVTGTPGTGKSSLCEAVAVRGLLHDRPAVSGARISLQLLTATRRVKRSSSTCR